MRDEIFIARRKEFEWRLFGYSLFTKLLYQGRTQNTIITREEVKSSREFNCLFKKIIMFCHRLPCTEADPERGSSAFHSQFQFSLDLCCTPYGFVRIIKYPN